MTELRLLPEVFDDTAQAARWSDEEGYEGLGDRFLRSVFECVLFVSATYSRMGRISQDRL